MKKISQQEMEERIKKRFPEETFTIIEYTSACGKGSIQCDKCKQVISLNQFNNFLAKNKRYGCKNCFGLWRDREVLLEQMKEKYNILSTTIKDTHTYYTVQCKKCHHQREIALGHFKIHPSCGCETGIFRNRTPEEFINEANKYHNNELELIGKYTKQTDHVLIRHKPCGMIWKSRCADIIHGRAHCPRCRTKESQGEKTIRLWLQKNHIPFEMQSKLEDSNQRFDFFLPQLNLAIEYQGRQHFEYIPFFHKNEEGFQRYQARDLKKKEYCNQKKILLLEISYLDFNNIESILEHQVSSTTTVGKVSEKAVLP